MYDTCMYHDMELHSLEVVGDSYLKSSYLALLLTNCYPFHSSTKYSDIFETFRFFYIYNNIKACNNRLMKHIIDDLYHKKRHYIFKTRIVSFVMKPYI